ncbi:hypothetical protein [Floridanema aerugineum]|uniref:Uncharacterized protein n=1 Tax=Floridaenema aerugineum BLCC-F46 TaxID=3153654 RepID=A0ABV4X848_9CYAN
MLDWLITLGSFLYLIAFICGLYCGWAALFSTNPFNGDPLSKSFSDKQFITYLETNYTADEYLAINLLIRTGILVYSFMKLFYYLELPSDLTKSKILLTRIGMTTAFVIAFIPPIATTFCFLFIAYKVWLSEYRR